MRTFGATAAPMKITNNGAANIPHHIRDNVAILPILSVPAVSNLVLSIISASLFEYNAYAIADGYVFIFDATIMPADGARTPIVVPKFVSAGTWLNVRPEQPYPCSNGIVLAFSSTINTAGAWNFTHSANAIFDGQIGAYNGEAS
jgi:hypothetical protein